MKRGARYKEGTFPLAELGNMVRTDGSVGKCVQVREEVGRAHC